MNNTTWNVIQIGLVKFEFCLNPLLNEQFNMNKIRSIIKWYNLYKRMRENYVLSLILYV